MVDAERPDHRTARLRNATLLFVAGAIVAFFALPDKWGAPLAGGLAIIAFFVGRHWVPERVAAGAELIEGFGVRSYVTEVLVLPTSPLVGKTLAQSQLGEELDLTVLRIVRDNNQYLSPRSNMTFEAGDVLLV